MVPQIISLVHTHVVNAIINSRLVFQVTYAQRYVEWLINVTQHPTTFNRQHLSDDYFLEVKRENYPNYSALHCVLMLCTMIRTHMWTVLKFACWFRFRFRFCVFVQFYHFVCFCVSLNHFYSGVACFCCVEFSLFSTKPRDWLRRTFPKWHFCVEMDVKP